MSSDISAGPESSAGDADNFKLRFYYRETDSQQIPLPRSGERNTLVTAALPYVNNEPHLGNIIGCVLSADVYARFARLRGDNTLFICGTDEYGTATETKAQEEGVTCQELCDKFHKIHASIYQDLKIDFNYFGRTATEHQTKIAQSIFTRLHEQGLTIERVVDQLHCSQCDRFLADRYVVGQCKHCGFADARGDQCDDCQRLLDATTDLIAPRCKVDGSTPSVRQSKHLFLDLATLAPELEKFVDEASASDLGKNTAEHVWSRNAMAVTRAWLKGGLKPRCITRDLKWGTPVPLPAESGYASKVFYVWFDAPIGYISITASLFAQANADPDAWKQWWQAGKPSNCDAEDNVRLVQFMGKDNTPFHTVVFPASLIGTKDPWTLLHSISTTEYLTYEGQKFSKSRNTGVFGSHVRDSGVPVSVWRYTLLANRPESSDNDFSWDDLVSRNNSELLANLGNFVNRIVTFVHRKLGGVVPSVDLDSKDDQATDEEAEADSTLHNEVTRLLTQYCDEMSNMRIRAALHTSMAASAAGNAYLQKCRISDALLRDRPVRCARVLAHGLSLISTLSALIYPFMPCTSASINRMLNLPSGAQPSLPKSNRLAIPCLPDGHKLNSPEYLFSRIDGAVFLPSIRTRFSGKKDVQN